MPAESNAQPDSASFDWGTVVPLFVHPVKVGIVEALWHIDEPISTADLERIFAGQVYLAQIDYHVQSLAKKGVLEKVSRPRTDGTAQNFYSLPPAT